MEHSPIGNGAREVRRHAAVRRLVKLDGLDAAGIVETHVVVDAEVVPLAGHDHVVVAVEPNLGGPPSLLHDQGRDGSEQRRLRFLAAEASAHAPQLYRHGVLRPAQNAGHVMLHFGRVLGRAIKVNVAVFLR